MDGEILGEREELKEGEIEAEGDVEGLIDGEID
jgi:hypothetical protein